MNTKRSDIDRMPEYFDRYILLVDDVELTEAFDRSIAEIVSFETDKLRALAGRVYEPGKWTVNTIIGHITDFERVLSYRTLVFARRAGITPQSIDEQIVAQNTNADRLDIGRLLDELRAVRTSTKAMFDNFDDEILRSNVVNWGRELSVLAMGFNIIGHQIHHFNTIRERYFPLLDESAEALTA